MTLGSSLALSDQPRIEISFVIGTLNLVGVNATPLKQYSHLSVVSQKLFRIIEKDLAIS